MNYDTDVDFSLPQDHADATLVGRAWRPDVDGPSVVALRAGRVFDISASAPTMRDLCESEAPAELVKRAEGEDLGDVGGLLANTPRETRDTQRPWLLSPSDLQAVKAAGVTFAVSTLERVIEEKAKGAPERAAEIRAEIRETIGRDLATLKPGSEQAEDLKRMLIEKDMWSQYLEVGIGPDAEIFTKMQPMSTIGHLDEVGLHPISSWNNPEPEVVLAANSRGAIVGASLGNDVNLRDVEGRSALLLSKAKDNNASGSVGPFIRLFDDRFTLDDVRAETVSLKVEGDDGFVLEDASEMRLISRDPADLVSQAIGRNHQYPDGFVLYLGTMFSPIKDRDGPGQGFTHHVGDMVVIGSPKLGRLANRVVLSSDAAPWTYGTAALMRNLAARRLI